MWFKITNDKDVEGNEQLEVTLHPIGRLVTVDQAENKALITIIDDDKSKFQVSNASIWFSMAWYGVLYIAIMAMCLYIIHT